MKTFNILVLHDGKPGHQTQSIGMANLIQRHLPYPSHTQLVRAKPRFKLLNKLARKLVEAETPLAKSLFFMCFNMETLPQQVPDLIVSFGGDVVAVNLFLSKQWQVPNIVNGNLQGMSHERVTAHVTAFGQNSHPKHAVVTRIALCKTKPDAYTQEGHALRNKIGLNDDVTLWSMIVGGDGGGYHYSDADWQTLAQTLQTLSESHGIRWLISTSRRTSAAGEALLKQHCQAICADAIWVGEGNNSGLSAYLGAAERIFCTEDSMSMLAESVAMTKPVVSLAPNQANPRGNHMQMVNHMEQVGLIERVSIAELSLYNPTEFIPVGSYDSHLSSIYQRLNDLGVFARLS